MKYLLPSLIFLILFSCNSEVAPPKPNFLVIVVDDLGYTDLSCMGSTFYETPHIDGIAEKGITFTQAYATCQVCSPSRASLMSGRFPARHGITDYIGAKTGEKWRKQKRYTPLLPPEYTPHLPHQYTTLPEALKEGAYKTFFAGKWHLGGEGSLPTDHGFDINQGGYHAGGPYSGGYFSPFNNPQMEDETGEEGMTLSMKLAQETSRFIEANQDTQFFAYLCFYAVHAPIQTREELWDKYRNKAEQQGIAEKGFAMERILPIRQQQDNPVYGGLIEQMDDAVGHVLQTLEKLGLDENTVVIFTSDNGGVTSGDNYSSNLAPLRGGKGYQWEGGIRVPFLMYAPGFNSPSQKLDQAITGADIYPTLLELAGLESKPDEHQDGKSLVSLIKGDEFSSRPLYWHYPHYGNQGGEPSSIIREGDWKLIHYWEDGRDELYNIHDDIGEQNDLAQKDAQRVEQMREKLMSWLNEAGARYAVKDPEFSADSLAMKMTQYKDVLLPRLEKQRKNMLSPDWQPNEDWWGSIITKD